MIGRRQDLILRRLLEEGETTLKFFQALDQADWGCRIYTEGSQWTVCQVLCHFVSAERGFHRLAQDILNGGAGAPEGLDVDVFNEGEVSQMGERTPADLLPEFERLRAKTIALLYEMREADLDRQGRHPFFGLSSLEKLLKLVYRHNMIHLRDIRRILQEA